MSFSEPRKALVVALDNLGDLVFSSVLFLQLHARWPRAQLSVWCKQYAEDVARLLPGSPRVFASDPFWHRSPGRPKGSLRRFIRACLALRRERFDLAIVATRPWRAAAFTAMLGIPWRIGYETPKARRFLTTPVAAPPSASEHVIQELNRLLVPLFPPDPHINYSLDRTALQPRKEAIMAKRRAKRGGASFVGLHAFAGDHKRCMALAQWLKLAEGIHRRGFCPMWVGSPTELEMGRRVSHTSTTPHEFSNDYGTGNVFDDAVLISESTCFIGHDSGPLHMASALGVPVLGLYLPSTPQRTWPKGTGSVKVLHRPSADQLAAEDVLAAFDQLCP